MSTPAEKRVNLDPQAPEEERHVQTVVQVSPLDSYIHERMVEQPKTLEDVVQVSDRAAKEARHRLSLPTHFRELSYDHTENGMYIFRWTVKYKRGIDEALNKGWLFVNRTYFPSAPRHAFSASGGIEEGDTILMFMPSKQALVLRERPGKISRERIAGRMKQVDKDYVIMTSNPDDPAVYKPELGSEAAETSERQVAGVMTEGRDF